MSRNNLASDAEFAAKLSDMRSPLIRTQKEWDEFCKGNGPFAQTPASKVLVHATLLSTIGRTIKFAGGGLAHLEYGNLKDILTYTEFMSFMSMFGISVSVLADRDNYECDGNHNCRMRTNVICLSSC